MLMQHFFAGIVCDLRLQTRYGLLVVVLLTGGMVGLGLRALALPEPAALLPALLLQSLVLTGFFVAIGQMMLERNEGSLQARGPTPLAPVTYLCTRVVTLALLNMIEALLIVGLVAGSAVQYGLVLLSMLLATSLFVLPGVIVAARAASLNQVLLPALLVVAPLAILPVVVLAGWDSALLALHPLYGPLLLLRTALLPGAAFPVVALLGTLAWLIGLGVVALRACRTALRG